MNSDNLPPLPNDYSDPLTALADGQRRLIALGDGLLSFAEELCRGGASLQSASQAAQLRQSYEEEWQLLGADAGDLLPQLARQSLKLADRVQGVRDQQQAMDEQWLVIVRELTRPTAITDFAAFRDRIDGFTRDQRQLLFGEMADLLELARHIFGSDDLHEFGTAMARRRGQQVSL